MSSIVAEMFTDVAACVLRLKDGSVIYRNEILDDPELTRSVIERAADLAKLPARPRLLSLSADVSNRFVALIRFFGGSALVVICERHQHSEARFRLEQFNKRDLHLFGGGLSNTAVDPADIFGPDEASGSKYGPCTASAVADFLNESFDFLFSVSSQSLRVAYCRSFGNHYEFLKSKGGKLIATDELHILDAQEKANIDHRFRRMVEGIDMEKLQSLESSPIASPCWRESPGPDSIAEVS